MSISVVGLAVCLIIIFVGIGCARRSVRISVYRPLFNEQYSERGQLHRRSLPNKLSTFQQQLQISRFCKSCTINFTLVCVSVRLSVCHAHTKPYLASTVQTWFLSIAAEMAIDVFEVTNGHWRWHAKLLVNFVRDFSHKCSYIFNFNVCWSNWNVSFYGGYLSFAVYIVSQKNPPCGFLTFFPNG